MDRPGKVGALDFEGRVGAYVGRRRTLLLRIVRGGTMHRHCSGTPPSSLLSSASRIQPMVEFWNGLRVSNDPGSTTWEALEQLERQVTECLYSSQAELHEAERLTAQAMFLMTGQSEL
jgi:hypothetical protein